jgi:hypothetical protein
MKFVNALALALGVIGGVLAYLSLGPASGVFFIWATFIATATGVALGGTKEAFKNLVVCGSLGVFLAWVASLIVLNVPLAATLTLPVWAGIVVGATTALLALAAHLPWFPAIPATVIGYASTFAYLLSTPNKLDNKVLLGFGIDNPLFVMIVSLLVAAAFGLVSLSLTAKLSKPAVAA